MEKLFDEDIRDNRSRIRLLRTICHFLPIMEAVDKLHNAVAKRNRAKRKLINDIDYWTHEAKIVDMDLRVYELLMKKRKGKTL